MKHIKTFENNNTSTDTYYEWYKVNADGTEEQFTLNEEIYKYDKYDLDSMIDTYIKVKGDKRGIKIKKVTIEDIDLHKTPSYVMKMDIKKYNL